MKCARATDVFSQIPRKKYLTFRTTTEIIMTKFMVRMMASQMMMMVAIVTAMATTQDSQSVPVNDTSTHCTALSQQMDRHRDVVIWCRHI